MKCVGIASDIAARDRGSAMGVWDLFYTKKLDINLDWQDIFFIKSDKKQLEILEELIEINTKIAKVSRKIIETDNKGVFFSGDHSGAAGIWSGVAEAKRKDGDIGLIWVDAHLDSHTPESSVSKNIHGMPVAFLLGQGNCGMSKILSDNPKIKPENICFVGIRSYQEAEQKMLEKLGCKIYYIEDVQKNGIKSVITEAYNLVSKNTVGFGMSFDIDGFDPSIAPGTGYIEDGGLFFDNDFKDVLNVVGNDSKFLGCEISEYMLEKDYENKTIILINNILNSLFSK